MASTNESEPSEARQETEQEPDRQAQPVDAEQPPRFPFPVIGVGASAGGIEAFSSFLAEMRPDSGMAFVFILHLAADRKSMLAEIFSRRTSMTVFEVEDGMEIEPNHVYVIRPGHQLLLQEGRLRLGSPLGPPRAANRPIDDFFKSLAAEQRERAICVILSGMGSNGTAGAQTIKAVGGLCIAQDPESAEFPSMPRHLIDAGYADYILRPSDIPEILLTFAGSSYARGGREEDAQAILLRDQQLIREIFAVLRTRTRHDFTGYKKPTVLRRVQRRMGLTRLKGLAEYARFLRQSPAEVAALADDLLIHVSGFFRDPDAWDTLRERAIIPLVSSRESGGSLRGWVTACSSGEEAYSLAMLLVEEAEFGGKRLDIKVFATDLADRTLAQARAGVYPGGIESEISPERLARFFIKEDEVYRVRPELRDRVVFAPQNMLQDPPFSRLDIVTCRNLLIYLEPEVQQRVLSLIHFGLRDGGTLFLGTSETVVGAEDLFEPIDRKSRIFRRIGPTRHGSVEFPLPQAVTGKGSTSRTAPLRPDKPILSIAQLTQRALLEQHSPAAVTLDRDFRVIYYHGDSHSYLVQPTGEPTRDLLLLAREGIRGAVRIALNRAAAENTVAVETGGWIDGELGRHVRVTVTISPICASGDDDVTGPPDYFVVSFAERGEVTPVPAEASVSGEYSAEEMQRLRAELQSTIEELQTSNEELKASNEEVMSINEELQSANEELETSKEEMQSLNEELITVNTQLRSKIEEHQLASSDLSSLLVSTDIAVLFLDTAFRIRRFTPAVRELVDLIAADIGRSLTALAHKFDDPHLNDDTAAVLERLVPIEREVQGTNGRHYLRRILPYRTIDNRIDGTVITFVDITARKWAEEALRESETRLREALVAWRMAHWTWDISTGKVSASETMEALFGLPPGESWEISAHGFRLIHPDDRERYQSLVETCGREKKGWHTEFRIVRPSDDRISWFEERARATKDVATGQFWITGLVWEITDRKHAEDELENRVQMRTAELRASQMRALQAERLAAIGQMIAGLAHESRNALQRGQACLSMLAYRLHDQPDALDLVDRVQRAQNDLSRLHEDVREYAAPLRYEPVSCDVVQLWREAWQDLAISRAEGRAELLEEVGCLDATCEGSPFHLKQVFRNLLLNALDATAGVGPITIRCSEGELEGRPSMRIDVRDNGPGFTAEEKAKAFEPFYSTKMNGTGLGLAICVRILEAHHGKIEIASADAAGGHIIVHLPRSGHAPNG